MNARAADSNNAIEGSKLTACSHRCACLCFSSSNRSSTSGIMFHIGGMPIGLGSSLNEEDSSNTGFDYSRSSTPPLSATPVAPPTANLPFEQLCAVGAALAAGIATSFETKKKDTQGKTYHSCFMGKEAVNWSGKMLANCRKKKRKEARASLHLLISFFFFFFALHPPFFSSSFLFFQSASAHETRSPQFV